LATATRRQRHAVTCGYGTTAHMITRNGPKGRGMKRLGFAILILWEAFVIFNGVWLLVYGNLSLDIWDWGKYLLECCIEIPAAVWACGRTFLCLTRVFLPTPLPPKPPPRPPPFRPQGARADRPLPRCPAASPRDRPYIGNTCYPTSSPGRGPGPFGRPRTGAEAA